MTEKKSNAGRKGNAKGADLNSLIEKAEYEMRRADATAINDLPKLYELRRDLALGQGELGKKASITNRKSAIDAMILQGERYAIGEAELLHVDNSPKDEVVAEVSTEEAKQVSGGDVNRVQSFAEKKAAYEALKKSKEQAE